MDSSHYKSQNWRRTDAHVYFWGGPFSQWSKHSFEVDGVTFNCAEQYMMACKARMFEEIDDTFNLIMATSNPRDQKALGRKVKNFREDEWNMACRDIVTIGNYHKFTQNPNIKDILMDTGGRIIVEGAANDKIWGVGLAWDDPRIEDEANWKGTNWLGESLMTVREMIKQTDDDDDKQSN